MMRVGTSLGKSVLPFILAMLLPLGLSAEALFHEQEGWAVDPPEGWVVQEVSPDVGYTLLASGDGQCIAQFWLFHKAGNEDPAQVAGRIRGVLKASEAEGGTSIYPWRDRRVVLSDLSWQNQGQEPSRGYLLVTTRGTGCLAVLVSASSKDWSAWSLYMISLLDSLAVNQGDWNLFGPISAMLQEGDVTGERGVQANQDLIEREAVLLLAYSQVPAEVQMAAWTRYYRMVYRDSFDRLAPFAADFRARLVKEKVRADQHVARLAAWLQDFSYQRLDTLSDLLSPLAAVNGKTGDCDARGLVFMITLRHWGIPSVLMVSPKHQHSMVGVDIQAEGARFPFANRNWLVAELTAKVALGQIEEKMSASADWFGMELEFNPDAK